MNKIPAVDWIEDLNGEEVMDKSVIFSYCTDICIFKIHKSLRGHNCMLLAHRP